jgi:hypothetical protein
MAMEYLVLAQHRNRLCYVIICEGDYLLQIYIFKSRDYTYMQRTTPTTLDVTIRHVIFLV